MSTLWKRRIAILVSIVLVFAVACLSGLTKGGIFLTAFAAGPTYAKVGTASLSDAGNTLFIRMAQFNVGTDEEPEIRYCSGFTVGDLGPEGNPTQNVNMDVLTPIWPDAPLTGTLDKDIYICGGADSVTADLYVNGLTQTEGHKLTAVGSFDVKMGALSVGEMIAPTVGVNIGDKASVTVNGNASVNYLWMYKPSRDNLKEGQADPAIYNPQYLGGTLHVTGNLSGGSGGYLYIDGGSAATVDGNVSGLGNNKWQCIQVSSEGSLTVGGSISVPGGIAISNSALSVTEGASAQNVVVNGGSAMNVGGDLSVANGGQIWALESSFTVGGSVNGSDVYIHGLPETATVGGKVTANNLWVSGTGDASTSKTALTVTGDVSVSAFLDINRCATVTADDVICNYLYMEEAGPNVLNATTFKCTSDSCLYRNSTLNVTGDCTLDTPLFNVQGDSHVNVGGDLTVKNFIDVQDNSSLTVEGDISFTEAYSYQLQAFGSGVITCKGNVAAKGAVSALRGGKIAVTGKLSSTDVLSVNAMGSGSEITADAIDAITVNAISGGKIAVTDTLSATTYALSVNALYGGSEITADAIDAEGCVSAIGNARVSVTGTLTTGDLGSLGVLAIGKDAVVEAENINAPYINALGYYNGAGGSGTSAVIVRNDANLSQWPVVDDGGTISVGGNLNCSSFSIYKQSRWNSEYTGWIRVGGDMRYAMNSGDISRGELTVGGDFINTAASTSPSDGLAVYGGKLNVGGNVEFGSLLLNTRGDNTPLNVTGRINATRITDIVAKDENEEPLKLHTVDPFRSAETDEHGVISYTQPWYTQYVLLEDDSGNSYRADVSDLTKTSYSAVPTIRQTVTVTNGTGGGSYAEGATVTITASAAPSGKRFKAWTGVDGLTFTSGSATTATAAFTMPARAVNITATYEDIPAVPVTGVTLNRTTLSLTRGNTATLTATVAPSNATNKAVTWSSGSPGVATVDANGKVTAVAAGTATITVTTMDGGKTAQCTVTVSNPTPSPTPSGGGDSDDDTPSTSSTTTTTTTNPDGSKTAVTTARDGSTTTTTTAKDGSATTTEKAADGSTGTVKTDAQGNTVSAEAAPSSKAIEDAAKSGEPVTLPVEVKAATSAASAAEVKVTLPANSGGVKVEIPTENLTPGTVAVIVHADGTEEIVKTSTTGGEGVVLTLSGSATVKIVDNTKPMNDVTGDEWYADSVAWATSHEVMNGMGDGDFSPGSEANRAQIAQLLFNLDGATADGNLASLGDVNAGDWYADAVTWMVENGIASGMGDDFGANEDVTREQLAVMLYNYARYKGYDTTMSGSIAGFPDAEKADGYARSALAWAVGADLINGTTDGSGNIVLDPQGSATRAQIAAIVERFCENVAR